MIERGLRMLRSQRHPLSIVVGLYHYTAVLQAMSRPQEAKDAIAEANAILETCPDPGVWPMRLAALERPRQQPRRNGAGTVSTRELVILRMLTGTLSERDIGRELSCHRTPSTATSGRSIESSVSPRAAQRWTGRGS